MTARELGFKAGIGAEAAVALTLASLALRALPRRRLARLLGRPEAAAPPDTRHARAAGASDARASRVGRAVERVARVLPWHPSCLPQAIATRAMLHRRGIPCEGHVGVVSMSPLEAHAWVTVDGHVVQGGPVRDATELAAFR